MLLILICILQLVTQRQAVLGQPAIKAVMGRLGNLKSAIRGRAANWCMRNCQSRVEPAKRVPTDGLHRASSRTYDHPTGVLLPLLYILRACRYGGAHTMILRQFDLGAELRSHYSADSLPPARVVLAHREEPGQQIHSDAIGLHS